MLILFISLRILFVFKSTPQWFLILPFNLLKAFSVVLVSPSFLYFFPFSINMIKTLRSLKNSPALYPSLILHPLFSFAFHISSLEVYFTTLFILWSLIYPTFNNLASISEAPLNCLKESVRITLLSPVFLKGEFDHCMFFVKTLQCYSLRELSPNTLVCLIKYFIQSLTLTYSSVSSSIASSQVPWTSSS